MLDHRVPGPWHLFIESEIEVHCNSIDCSRHGEKAAGSGLTAIVTTPLLVPVFLQNPYRMAMASPYE